jgi:hypothetical protein
MRAELDTFFATAILTSCAIELSGQAPVHPLAEFALAGFAGMMAACALALCRRGRRGSPPRPACRHVAYSDHLAAVSERDEEIKRLKAALTIIRFWDWGWKGGGNDIRVPGWSGRVASEALGLSAELPLGWPSEAEYAADKSAWAVFQPEEKAEERTESENLPDDRSRLPYGERNEMKVLILKLTAAAATFYAIVAYPHYAAIFAFLWGYAAAMGKPPGGARHAG